MRKKRALWTSSIFLVLLSFGLSTVPLLAAGAPRTAHNAQTKKSTKSWRSTQKRQPAPAYSARQAQARRAKLAKARAATQAREMAALSVPRFKVDDHGVVVPDVRAEAAIIYNPETKQVLWEEHSQDQRSIASITKVMTAICFLEARPDLSRPVSIEYGDVHLASTTYLHSSERIYVDDLLHLMLIASDNGAARALARISPLGTESFIRRMNEKAAELELASTSYADPSGLDAANVSSAYDMARLITYAASDPRISSIMRTAEYSFTTSRGTKTVRSTNQLVRYGDVDVIGGKTGFIGKAGYCLATLLRLPGVDQQVAVVVLGARSNAGRFMETRHLLNWMASKASVLLGEKTEQHQQ